MIEGATISQLSCDVTKYSSEQNKEKYDYPNELSSMQWHLVSFGVKLMRLASDTNQANAGQKVTPTQ